MKIMFTIESYSFLMTFDTMHLLELACSIYETINSGFRKVLFWIAHCYNFDFYSVVICEVVIQIVQYK